MDSQIIFPQYEFSFQVYVLNSINSLVFQEKGKVSLKDDTVEKFAGGEKHGNDFSAADDEELKQLKELKELKENAFYAYHKKDTQDIQDSSSSTAKTPKMYTPLGPVGLKYLTSSIMPKINTNDDQVEDILKQHKKNKDLVKEYKKNISNQKLEDIIKKFRENEDFLKEYRKNISDFSFI